MGKLNHNINDWQRTLTQEERSERARIAGRASAVMRGRRKALRELLDDALRLPPGDPAIIQALEDAGLEANYGNAVILAMMTRAAQGDVEAAKYVRDTVGERPVDVAQLTVAAGPVQAMDLSRLTDDQLAQLASDRVEALPDRQPRLHKVALEQPQEAPIPCATMDS